MVGPLDDLDRPFPDLAQRLAQLVAGIATIGEDVPEPRMAADDLGEDERYAIAILHASGVDHGTNQIAIGIGHDVTLDPPIFPPRVIRVWPDGRTDDDARKVFGGADYRGAEGSRDRCEDC